ncbi:methionyl-tRNA formyltransferase [Thermodesulfobacterium sp. TA1]|uniref:methionyl-tRNA formyltransferase n=1 Tax=Thermodesulfobacterium sp. TA1 TaxID=2234087 RepID=UPI00123238C0|nr:methionyl-tRNA formyltransferase [Thermodesulfobacterium sp. TA1]QER41930.1 methionyl-tRNA formyltransferase [Thermodesulfobacterium sp. TA1]
MRYRIVYFGSPEFAIHPLEGLYEKEKVLAVVTQPDKPQGRGLKTLPCAVKSWALGKGLYVLDPPKIKGNEEFLKALKDLSPELIVVCAYGKILPKEVLEVPKFGCWNIHASLLPKYRGASPINWAILEGEKETGITIMLMDEGLDTGPILLQKKIPINPEDNALTLSQKLSQLGKEAILEAIELHKKGLLKPTPQPDEGVSYAPLLKKEDGFFTFEDPAWLIERKVKAFIPWPTAYTYIQGKIFKVYQAKAQPSEKEIPGKILRINQEGLLVATSEGAILLIEVQPEGKKKMSGFEFACGRRFKPGDLLI